MSNASLRASTGKELIESISFGRYEVWIAGFLCLHIASKLPRGPAAFVIAGFNFLLQSPDLNATWEWNNGDAVHSNVYE